MCLFLVTRLVVMVRVWNWELFMSIKFLTNLGLGLVQGPVCAFQLNLFFKMFLGTNCGTEGSS